MLPRASGYAPGKRASGGASSGLDEDQNALWSSCITFIASKAMEKGGKVFLGCAHSYTLVFVIFLGAKERKTIAHSVGYTNYVFLVKEGVFLQGFGGTPGGCPKDWGWQGVPWTDSSPCPRGGSRAAPRKFVKKKYRKKFGGFSTFKKD